MPTTDRPLRQLPDLGPNHASILRHLGRTAKRRAARSSFDGRLLRTLFRHDLIAHVGAYVELTSFGSAYVEQFLSASRTLRRPRVQSADEGKTRQALIEEARGLLSRALPEATKLHLDRPDGSRIVIVGKELDHMLQTYANALSEARRLKMA